MIRWFRKMPDRVAVMLAWACVLVSGAGHRLLAPTVSSLDDMPPIPKGCLADLPLRIGEWSGRDQPIDERTEGILDADDHIRRVYLRRGSPAVSVFVAAWRRDVAYAVPAAQLVPHHPEVCFPAHGWKLENKNVANLSTQKDGQLPVEFFRFFRGPNAMERTTVLTYYIVDGKRASSPTELRPSGWRPKGDIRYVAQVEISGADGSLVGSGEALAKEFAVDSEAEILSAITFCLDSKGH